MTKEITTEEVWAMLNEVEDPEIPVISVVELGVVHEVNHIEGNKWEVKMTPTYTGCPAVQFMALRIEERLKKAGIVPKVDIVLTPTWTTDYLTEEGRRKLLAYGITPPQEEGDIQSLFGKGPDVPCARCGSTNTEVVSQFGSTACKALYKCNDCHEPFDYFKCHR